MDEAGKIFVGGLPKGCSQEKLESWAAQFGAVAKVEVRLDQFGTPRGFGFVFFQDAATAQVVLASKETNTIDGKWVDCKAATPPGTMPPSGGKGGMGGFDPSNLKIFVGALPRTATEASVTGHFAQFGAVKECMLKLADDGQCKGYCFVTFESADSVKMVLDNSANNQFEGKWIDCKSATPQDKGKGKGMGKGVFGGFGGCGGGYGAGYGGGCGGGYGGCGGGGCGGGYGGGYGGGCSGGGYGGGYGGGAAKGGAWGGKGGAPQGLNYGGGGYGGCCGGGYGPAQGQGKGQGKGYGAGPYW
ncbi:unnamed protein product [Polarella glacialis]|uniref:RRM domain-containing protein n=1 Tax=Polarella glacialis TaxID=89957 RepID=A0A813I2Q2_POLGL|nr:unnamed protein product [Polarella glacialis]